jgi:HAD superfamily phosphatase (TIGR01668 family)
MTFLKPTIVVDGDVTDINLEQLRADGIRGIVLDLDSTIVAPRSGVLTPEAAEWLTRARSHFKLAVVSNNKKAEYLTAVQKVLEMPVVGNARKPGLKVLLDVLAQLELTPAECVLIGDRPLTDIFAGQRAGMKTVLVYPLKTMNEPGWIGFVRRLERLFIKA